jgi:signal transduction histidine kinase
MRTSGTRLAAQLFLLAVLVTAACAWTALALVRTTFVRQLHGELESMVSGVGLALQEKKRGLSASLAEMEDYLRQRDPLLLEQLLLHGAESADAAALLLPRFSLDALEILDDEGRIVSSSAWPERVGLDAGPALRELPPGEPVIRDLPGVDERGLALLRKREVMIGSRSLQLVGGSELDRAFIERVAGRQAALLVRGAGDASVVSGLASDLSMRDIRGQLSSSAEATDVWRVAGAEGSRWDARAYPLPETDGVIVLAVDRGRLDSLIGKMRRAFLLLGGGVGLLSALAGIWIARRASRPVNDLVRAFDAMAAGEADYSFPLSREHELQELIASISRLHRALDLQRRKSVAAERVAAWSDVARLVAHEVKNPLAPIRLTAENLLRARRDAPERFDDMFREGMNTIMEEVEQLRRLVAEFSEFARLPQPIRRPEDPERLLDAVVDLYAADPGIRIERSYAGKLPKIDLDADQISMVFKNVLGNAVEASREKSKERERPMAIEVGSVLEENMVRFVIADRGPGFSEEAERRLCEPYFTTKSGGTGLGMALTNRIIVEHGGLIAAENRKGGGAIVSILLPLQPAE